VPQHLQHGPPTGAAGFAIVVRCTVSTCHQRPADVWVAPGCSARSCALRASAASRPMQGSTQPMKRLLRRVKSL
jgi:hypothetical protein